MGNELKQYASIDDALSQFGIPDANRPFIKNFIRRIPISGLFETSGYIKAVRADGGPDMHIASGWSNGFVSEAEVLDVCGDVERWGDDERARVWGVSHPENRIGHGGGGDAGTTRSYGTCPICFMEYSASGACGCS